ncbi:hypothetical protein [Thiohalomonas denitrificans]|uniref:hypothetical protein n=1 Tax=Thiohalomonas denitrificans TaxID=415747 RepID=UPI0026F00D4F|nr:hypothetical protein [Thiohalomonas denitrificans]
MNLKFKRLVLVSDTIKSANQFKFQERFNLITGKNNSIGKSSLVKSIYWALGCEPEFDETWNSLDCKALLEFSIGENCYVVVRTHNLIVLGVVGGTYHKYGRITGEFSEEFSELVGFKAKLPKRGDDPVLDTPPPAYYFLPFYIDQLRSWTSPWNSFQNLAQYAKWKQPIVKYHTGYLSPEHFELEEHIFEYEAEKQEANEEIKKINTAIDIVERYVPKSNLALTPEKFEEITKEVKQELGELAEQQELLLSSLCDLQSSKYHLENQLEIATRAVKEIESDYQFSVEYVDSDELECPLCGTAHDNSLASRASILSDKKQAEDQVLFIQEEISALNVDIEYSQTQLESARLRIYEINEKYGKKTDDKEKYNLTDIVDSFSSQSVQRNVEYTKIIKQALCKENTDKQKELKKFQKRLLTNDRKQELSDFFTGLITEFIEKLNSKGVNLSKVKHPTDYTKLFGSGGAAEGTRAALAYQMAVFRQIYYSRNEIPAPLVIDTPNQQEQANQNYERIVNLILKDTPSQSQVILCGMDSQYLKEYKKKANVITLDEGKLLNRDAYIKLSKEVSQVVNAAQYNYNGVTGSGLSS